METDSWRFWLRNRYDKNVSLADFFGDVIKKTGGPLPPGRVLDVGCGPVSVLSFHRAEGTEPIGIDPLGITYAEEGLMEWDAHTTKPIPVIALPAEKLPFSDETFDHVVCFNAIDHVSDPPAVLREMRRVLRTAGTLRVWLNTFATWIKRFLVFDTPHPWHWDHHEFRRLVQQAGFHVVHELAGPMNVDLSSLQDKLRYFHYWIATGFTYGSYFQFSKGR